ncbi:MAG: hypothetical protein LBQ49_00185 [Rickettsiales bacterium]|nr:hypothetical protein [Rickettsiales bacterium]
MKKIVTLGLAGLLLASCVGLAQGRSKTSGKTTYDMYVLHPIITISGYTSQL